MSENVDKVSDWLWRTLGVKNWSRQEVESQLLRGPFKDVLLQFLLRRVRSAEEVALIRSNLFLHSLGEDFAGKSKGKSKEVLELERQLAELEVQKKEKLTQLAELGDELNRTENEDGISPNFALKWKQAEVKALEDAEKEADKLLEQLEPYLVKEEDSIVGVDVPGKLGQVHEMAIKVFRVMFLQGYFGEDDCQELNERMEKGCEELVTIMKQQRNTVISDWQAGAIAASENCLKAVKKKAVSNSVEELEEELQNLRTTLCEEHVALGKANQETKQKLEELKAMKQEKLEEYAASFAYQMNSSMAVAPPCLSLLLKLVYEAQLLALLNDKDLTELPSTSGFKKRLSMDPEFVSEELRDCENLEDLLSSLIRSYPATKAKFGATSELETFSKLKEFLKGKLE